MNFKEIMRRVSLICLLAILLRPPSQYHLLEQERHTPTILARITLAEQRHRRQVLREQNRVGKKKE